jgi:hypothetical protein
MDIYLLKRKAQDVPKEHEFWDLDNLYLYIAVVRLDDSFSNIEKSIKMVKIRRQLTVRHVSYSFPFFRIIRDSLHIAHTCTCIGLCPCE